MSLIKKGSEISFPKTVKMMIFGQAGVGKSTLAISAPNPLYLDFDNSAKRLNDAHQKELDMVQVNSWGEIKQLLTTEINSVLAFNTIVVDTIGKMMDFIIAYKCGTKQPSIRDWGTINQEFTWFTRTLSQLNRNVVFVAHRDTRKEGDRTVFIPALREKNYNAIITELDLLGYLEMKSINGTQRRTITFDPTDVNDGKNTCYLPSIMEIPTTISNGQVTAPNDFVAKSIIAPYFNMLAIKEENNKKYNELVADIEKTVKALDADGLNAFKDEYKSKFAHIGNSLAVTRSMIVDRAKELDLVFDKDSNKYIQNVNNG